MKNIKLGNTGLMIPAVSLGCMRITELPRPEEVAKAFDRLYENGKVRYFGVSNHRPLQIDLLKQYVRQEICTNQMQLSIPYSGMISKEKILDAMKKAGEPLNAGKIAELTGLDRKVVDKTMTAMKKEGSIVSPVRCKWEPAEK